MSTSISPTRLLRQAGVMPVVTVRDTDSAVRIARALIEGGINAIEITLRSSAALDAIAAVRAEVPTMLAGAGTVLSGEQLFAAENAGAHFIVTPGTPPSLADTLGRARVPVIPGAATVSEILSLSARGFDAVKLFPAEPLGGVAMVKALRGPLPNIGLCPTGGIAEAQLSEYLSQPNVLCVGGSWLVLDSWVAAGDYASITEAARRAADILATVKSVRH